MSVKRPKLDSLLDWKRKSSLSSTLSEETLLRRFALVVAPGALTVGERGSTRTNSVSISSLFEAKESYSIEARYPVLALSLSPCWGAVYERKGSRGRGSEGERRSPLLSVIGMPLDQNVYRRPRGAISKPLHIPKVVL